MKKITLKLFTLFFLVASMLSITPALGGLFVKNANASMSNASYNVSSNSLTRVMCNALRIVTGTAGKTFAAFAIIAVGIGFFSGKVSWGLMIGVAAGIAAMFGAPSIVAAISGQNTDISCEGIN
jgi:type IV secretory pathway VirB2 component (pilin)